MNYITWYIKKIIYGFRSSCRLELGKVLYAKHHDALEASESNDLIICRCRKDTVRMFRIQSDSRWGNSKYSTILTTIAFSYIIPYFLFNTMLTWKDQTLWVLKSSSIINQGPICHYRTIVRFVTLVKFVLSQQSPTSIMLPVCLKQAIETLTFC